MQSSLLNNLCNDNNVQNQLFFPFHKFFESHFQKSKNNPVEILTGRSPLLKSVITLTGIFFYSERGNVSVQDLNGT